MGLDPTQIGRYKVLGTLGQGAMGTVYLAEDPVLRRGIAIKVVRGGTGDQSVMARFKREAEISARLNHPNIITIFDVGEEPGLGTFLAMEFVDGEGLDTILKAGPMPLQEGMQWLLQAGKALEAIHQAGVVHRDVKPSNFMTTKDGRLKLMDFGIARSDQPKLTTTATFLGTPAYAAPESLVGTERPADAADRWALAVTAFEVLTGRLPFQAESVNAVLYRVAHEPPQFPGDMSPQLRGVFEKALAKAPGERYPDIPSFLQDLLEALPLGEEEKKDLSLQLKAPPATAGPMRRLTTKARPGLRRRMVALSLGGLAILGGLGYWLSARNTRVVAIHSNPAGARVLLDGTELGRTPLPEVVIRGHAGKLVLEKPDYLPLEHVLTPEETRLDLRLVPAPFSVKVVTDPPHADIFLDGKPQGASPQTVTVPGEGRHQLEIRAEGYDTWSLVPSRHEPLPGLIHLRKRAPQPRESKDSKVKRFLKDLLNP